MNDKYNLSHEDCMIYLYEIYIRDFRRRFVRCYINKILHFETTMTSRSENEHAMLKRQLREFIDDLKNVVKIISLILINQFHNHFLTIA
jgi:hypothetical protein